MKRNELIELIYNYFRLFRWSVIRWLSPKSFAKVPFSGGDKDEMTFRANPYVQSLFAQLQQQNMEDLIIICEHEILPVARECDSLKREIKELTARRKELVKVIASTKAICDDIVTVYKRQLTLGERLKLWRLKRTIVMSADEFLNVLGQHTTEDPNKPKPPREGIMSIITLFAVSGFVGIGWLHLLDIDLKQVIEDPTLSNLIGTALAFVLGFGMSAGAKKGVIDGLVSQPNNRFNYAMIGGIVALEIAFVTQGTSGLLSFAQSKNPLWTAAAGASGALGVAINMYIAWSTAQKHLAWKADLKAWEEKEANNPERAKEAAEKRRKEDEFRQAQALYHKANSALKDLEPDLQEKKGQLDLRLLEQNNLLDDWFIGVRFALQNGSGVALFPPVRDSIRSARGVQEWGPVRHGNATGDGVVKDPFNGGSSHNRKSQANDSAPEGLSQTDEPETPEEEQNQAA